MKGLKDSKIILGIFAMILGLSLVLIPTGRAKESASSLMDEPSKIDEGKAALTNIAGVWDLAYDWGCTGSHYHNTWTIDQILIFLQFTSGDGGSGIGLVWKNKVALKYTNGQGAGSLYIGTLSNNNTYMSGTMKAGEFTGCFTADKRSAETSLDGLSSGGQYKQ